MSCKLPPAIQFLSTLPARGATPAGSGTGLGHHHFYPRSPRGERRDHSSAAVHAGIISIHAPREGSDVGVDVDEGFALISIHAPREGSDTTDAEAGVHLVGISIHAPREGSDPQAQADGGRSAISIHAPREGSDSKCAEK